MNTNTHIRSGVHVMLETFTRFKKPIGKDVTRNSNYDVLDKFVKRSQNWSGILVWPDLTLALVRVSRGVAYWSNQKVRLELELSTRKMSDLHECRLWGMGHKRTLGHTCTTNRHTNNSPRSLLSFSTQRHTQYPETRSDKHTHRQTCSHWAQTKNTAKNIRLKDLLWTFEGSGTETHSKQLSSTFGMRFSTKFRKDIQNDFQRKNLISAKCVNQFPKTTNESFLRLTKEFAERSLKSFQKAAEGFRWRKVVKNDDLLIGSTSSRDRKLIFFSEFSNSLKWKIRQTFHGDTRAHIREKVKTIWVKCTTSARRVWRDRISRERFFTDMVL